MAIAIMFWLCESFSKIKETQRILNQERTTHITKTARFKAGNGGFSKHSVKIRQEFLYFSAFRACLPTLCRSKNFFCATRNHVQGMSKSEKHNAL